MADRLLVNEVFCSIQGESSWAGWRCVFVRLTGCNLRCAWCDTQYAYDEGESMTMDEIVACVRSHDCPLVELTGGEPLIQPGSLELMTRLADEGLTVLLETNGSCDIGPVDRRVIRIVDIKCPGSGQADRNLWSNLDKLTERDEVKFVLTDRADYDWAVEVVRRFRLPERCTVLFSVVPGRLGLSDLASWVLGDRVRVRVQPQLHKVIWPDESRSV